MTLKNASILIVDDDPDVLTAVKILLRHQVKEVVTERFPENLRELLPKSNFDLILMDMNFKASVNTGNEGLFWLRNIREWSPQAAVIMITAYGDIELAVKSMKEGARDFIIKPWHNHKLLQIIKEVIENKPQQEKETSELKQNELASGLLGQSESMQDLFMILRKVAPTDANILLTGENGTGKDLVAQALHHYSLRKTRPFVKVDLGAISPGLFESELFGHKKGAFTDAHQDRVGYFESAHQGTIFLDEITNTPLSGQAKLLTVLQNKQLMKVGTSHPVDVDVRVIAATNVYLPDMIEKNLFRKDLYYRINTVELNLPPLRERTDDIPLLAGHFLEKYATKYFKQIHHFDEKALEKLKAYSFPGNVRELQYTIERAVIMSDGEYVEASDIIFNQEQPRPGVTPSTSSVVTNLGEMEKQTILKVIEKHHGNITQAAKELGLTRTALYRRLHKYDL